MNSKLTIIIGGVLFASVCTRSFHLSHPNVLVFDESYYSSVCELYSRQKFHFDQQPSLFKIMICFLLPQKFFQSNLQNQVNAIVNFNVILARLISALLGVCLVVVVYRIVLLLKYSHFAALISAFLITFDNGLIVQSRLMVADSFHHVLMLASFFVALKENCQLNFLSHVSFGLAVSTNLSSFSLFPVMFLLAFLKSWLTFTDVSLSLMFSLMRGLLNLISVVVVPLMIYFFITMLHILLLPNSGPHNSLMSSAFQASLNGVLQSNANVVTYGSHIRLRAAGDIQPYGTCYLKSIVEFYPVTYSDGRGSSAQQIVSCCHSENRNSLFEIQHPVDSVENFDAVLNNDVIVLQHVASKRLLNTHDVAAPLSKHKQEVSCYVDHNASFPTKFEWKVKFVNRHAKQWFNFFSYVFIEHVDTEAYLSVSGVPLPSWGKGCNEVVGEMPIQWVSEPTPWNAEIISTKKKESKILHQNYYSLWDKTYEYIKKVLVFNKNSQVHHRFASEWYEWPLASTSIAYWYDAITSSQIHFTGNVFGWIGGLIFSMALIVYYLTAITFRQMHVHLVSQVRIKRMELVLMIFGLSYICYFSSFIFTYKRPLFAYQYLPCVIFLHILQACALEEFCISNNLFICVGTFLYLVSVMLCYNNLRPITYGFSNITKAQLETLRYWRTWDVML